MSLSIQDENYIASLYTSSLGSPTLARAMFLEAYGKETSFYHVRRIWRDRNLDARSFEVDSHQVRSKLLKILNRVFKKDLNKISDFLGESSEKTLKSCM